MASITFVWFLLFVFVGTEAVQFHRAVIKTGPLDFSDFLGLDFYQLLDDINLHQ